MGLFSPLDFLEVIPYSYSLTFLFESFTKVYLELSIFYILIKIFKLVIILIDI